VIIFSLALIPIMSAIAAAVDYSRASAARTSMQAALDSAALMLSKDAANLTSAQLQSKANAYFNAMFTRPEVSGITITPAFSSPQTSSYILVLTGSGSVKTTFAAIFGMAQITISARSQVNWGIRKLELALALDNTGSMGSSGKIAALKTAAHNLLATLKAAAKSPGDIKVAIIPFDTTVNIGTSYKDQGWFDVANPDCSGCNSSNWKSKWDGCVRDRAQPYDVQDDSPTSSNSKTLYPVYDCGTLTTAMPLSYDWTALNSKIDAMTPNGNTDVTIGLVWAWHALTPNAPLTEGSAPSPGLDKAIIILTDGDNTEAWDNTKNQTITSQTAIDTRTAAVCANIKAANIKLYAIRVIDGNATLLSACATNPTQYYFNVQQADQLNSVFLAIAQSLANLRIAQ
jgi:Flp pilus assembly protein TadG